MTGPAHKVEIKFGESESDDPLNGEDIIWISAADGSVVRSEMPINNREVGPGKRTIRTTRTRIEQTFPRVMPGVFFRARGLGTVAGIAIMSRLA